MHALRILEARARQSKSTLTIKVNARETKVRWGYGVGRHGGEVLRANGGSLEDLLDTLLSHLDAGVRRG